MAKTITENKRKLYEMIDKMPDDVADIIIDGPKDQRDIDRFNESMNEQALQQQHERQCCDDECHSSVEEYCDYLLGTHLKMEDTKEAIGSMLKDTDRNISIVKQMPSDNMQGVYFNIYNNNILVADKISRIFADAAFNATLLTLNYMAEANTHITTATMSEMCKLIDPSTK